MMLSYKKVRGTEMKSKSVFIVLLFSLFLNIAHDILIAYETTACHTSLTLEERTGSDTTECCSGLSDLHEIFHFFGILSSFFNIGLPDFGSVKLFFISFISPIFIQQTTFKPPIV